MSSITEARRDPRPQATSRRERGQVMVLFVLALVALMAAAALAFDVGQMLVARRTQQDASDAAALAAARYLTDPGCADAASLANCPSALQAALDSAQSNGFGTGTNGATDSQGRTVTVKIPPGPESPFAALDGYVEVQIGSDTASVFGGVIGISTDRVTAVAVAANQRGIAAPYSFLALNPTACPAALFSGNGSVQVGGNIQVNSSCPTDALQVTGNATVDVTVPSGACNVNGGVQKSHNGTLDCDVVTPAPALPDPLETLPPPPVPALAPSPVLVAGSGSVPVGCPGSTTPATLAAPALCNFTSSTNVWRLYPGLYPGGIRVNGTVYLEPGIYYIAGGGITANSNTARVYSVGAGGSPPPAAGGILIYNTEDATFHSGCADGTAPNATVDCIQPLKFNGASTIVQILPLASGTLWDGLVIFQDRTLTVNSGADLDINGSATNLSITGTVYVPSGDVSVNGSGGTANTTQIIADTFKVNGSSGTLSVNYDGDSFFKLSGVGLVQ